MPMRWRTYAHSDAREDWHDGDGKWAEKLLVDGMWVGSLFPGATLEH
jgi:hypothetical protein